MHDPFLRRPGRRGQARELADGGSVAWLARLLSDRRERLFASGIGLEPLLPRRRDPLRRP